MDAEHGFATGLRALTATGSEPHGCTSQIWRTADRGASWQVVPGTCVAYLLTSLSFPTPQVGYAGGGNYAKFSQVPQLALLATADGGRSWTPEGVVGSELAVAGPTGAWLAGGTPGPNVLWRSGDGGRSWAPVASAGQARLSALLVAGQRLWASTEAGQFMSRDGGQSWHRPPRWPPKAAFSVTRWPNWAPRGWWRSKQAWPPYGSAPTGGSAGTR